MYSVLSTRYSVLGTGCLRVAAFLLLATISTVSAAAPPKLTSLYPAGGQQGTTVAITAAGDFSAWPVQVWSDRAGLTATAEKDKGRFSVAIAADAAPGVYWLRAFNSDGAAALRPFIVGTLPEVPEVETNDLPDKPQAISGPVVINGKLAKSNDVDGYRVELKARETLVASLQANSILGAPMDAVLQVCQLVERRYVAPAATSTATSSGTAAPRGVEAYTLLQNHDATGTDPQIAFTAPAAGEYLVRLFAFPATPDSTVRFAGGDDYLYRLTLTTGPYLDHAMPLAAPLEEAQVQLGGWNLPSQATAIVPPFGSTAEALAPPDGALAWVWRPGVAGASSLKRMPLPVAPSSTTELAVPFIVGGRLAQAEQTDRYSFVAQKDQKLRVQVAAKALGFPTDAVLAILDESGATLAEADDTGRDDRDPQLDFTPPKDGKYIVTVKDLAGRGGLRMVYRLSIEPVQPDYLLSLAADSFVLEKDKPLEIPINVTARDGFKETIEIHAIGLPNGVVAEPVNFTPSGETPMADSSGRRGRRSSNPPAASGPSVKLVVKAKPGSELPAGIPIRIEGRTAGDSSIVRSARFPLNLPLAGQHHAVWLTFKK